MNESSHHCELQKPISYRYSSLTQFFNETLQLYVHAHYYQLKCFFKSTFFINSETLAVKKKIRLKSEGKEVTNNKILQYLEFIENVWQMILM